MTTWRMRIACSIPKDTNTHSQFVILIAFPLQQWLHIHASMLRYTYIACLLLRSLLSHVLRYWIIFCQRKMNDYGERV